MIRLFLISLSVIVFMSCGGESVYTPKPRAFPKVEYPKGNQMDSFVLAECPFHFDFPSYADVVRDTSFFNQLPSHPCWFDLVTPQLNARVHFSYYPIGPQKSLDRLINDAFKLSSKHNSKANYIEETKFKKSKDVSGLIFRMEGPVATPYQLFITDSTQHFLRAALYVNASARPDSLQPVYAFLEKDIDQMLSTFRWKRP